MGTGRGCEFHVNNSGVRMPPQRGGRGSGRPHGRDVGGGIFWHGGQYVILASMMASSRVSNKA